VTEPFLGSTHANKSRRPISGSGFVYFSG
jgi:hypothetical protein